MKKIIIYQVLPRLFGNKNTNRIKNGSIQENGCGKFSDFNHKALKEIKSLGISHIWYTGILEHATTTDYSNYQIPTDSHDVVKGKAGSPYAVKDYYDVCPDLAADINLRMTEFESLIERTHKEEMKVIIDFIPNHLARHYISDVKPSSIEDFGEKDNSSIAFSASNNFYYITGEEFVGPEKSENQKWTEKPAKVTGNDCVTASPGINDWYETVKLNYGVNIFNGRSKHFNPIPDTWTKMLEILLYWSAKGVDGFRCDMAEMVPVEFWQWVTQHVKKQYPDIIFIGEVYNPELYRDFIRTGGFDYLYDKVGLYDTLKSIIQGHKSCRAITKAWENIHDIHGHMLFFLENHDEQRIASPFFADNPFKAIPAMIISGCIFKNPFMLYFGQELGEPGMDNEGFSGEDGRTSIFDYWSMDLYQKWLNNGLFNLDNLPEETVVLRNWYQNFLTIISNNEIISQGKFYDLMWANDDNPNFDSFRTFAFIRYYNKKIIIVVANFSPNKKDCRIIIPAHAFLTMELDKISYFRGHNLLNPAQKISFPKEVAATNGIGISMEGYSGTMFELRY